MRGTWIGRAAALAAPFALAVAARAEEAATPVANLFLAGDWVQTGLPATIESAVVSGRSAAAHALALPAVVRRAAA